MIYFLVVCLTALAPATIRFAAAMQEASAEVVAQRAQILRLLQFSGGPPTWLRLLGMTPQQFAARFSGMTPQQIALQVVPPPTIAALASRAIEERVFRRTGAALFAPVAWVLLTAAGMMIFQFSMRRARVRPIHALRCVFYSADVLVWVNLVLTVTLAGILYFDIAGSNLPWSDQYGESLWELLLLAAFFVFNIRMVVAARRYLRFDHAVATVMVTQVMAYLVVQIAIMYAFYP